MGNRPNSAQKTFVSGVPQDHIRKVKAPLSAFEQLCKRLRIDPTDTDAHVGSFEIRDFVRRKKESCFIPEATLGALQEASSWSGNEFEGHRVANPAVTDL
jgi:hypothetical protein